MKNTHERAVEILGPYAMLHDLARLQYGRLLWKRAASRERLLRHWTDLRHPYRDRFLETWQRWWRKCSSPTRHTTLTSTRA